MSKDFSLTFTLAGYKKLRTLAGDPGVDHLFLICHTLTFLLIFSLNLPKVKCLEISFIVALYVYSEFSFD